jgi:hypothetical protein
MDGWKMDGWMNECMMGGWKMDGWVGRWMMNGWKERKKKELKEEG